MLDALETRFEEVPQTVAEAVNALDDPSVLKVLHKKEKHSQIAGYLGLCTKHMSSSEEVLTLGKRIQNECQTRARDALHIASVILGGARYFLSCDRKVTLMKLAKDFQTYEKTLLSQTSFEQTLLEEVRNQAIHYA